LSVFGTASPTDRTKISEIVGSNSREPVSMRKFLVVPLAASLFLFSDYGRAQSANPCDLNQDGNVDAADVALAVDTALGVAPCTDSVLGAGPCSVVLVQRIVHAALDGTCITSGGHSVTLSWTGSISSNIAGYNVYRATSSIGTFSKVNVSLVNGTSYHDTTVLPGQTYYYVATAVDGNGKESMFSTPAVSVTVPTS
jgi:Fibronectin type III domain